MESASAKSISKKRLVPLLEAKLNDQRIPQLVWLDKEKRLFRMPWRYHKAAKWGNPEAFMLREVAKVMYSYNGPDIPTKKELSDWKELLRNNLNTLGDFEELHSMHDLKGDNPYKVYRFVSDEAKQRNAGKHKTVRVCQGQGNNCRQNVARSAAESSSSTMADLNSCMYAQNDSVNHGYSVMSHPGICSNSASDIESVSSSQESGCQGDSSSFSTILRQPDSLEELFQNNDLFHHTRQFDVDALNDAFHLEFNATSSDNSSLSEGIQYVNGLDFLEDSPSQAVPLMHGAGASLCDNAADDNVNVSSSLESIYHHRGRPVTSSCSNSIGGSISMSQQPVDEDDLSEERFMIPTIFSPFNASALSNGLFNFGLSEPNIRSSNFRSRSPLTANLAPQPTISSSYTSSSCNTGLVNSTQRASPDRLNQHDAVVAGGTIYNNIPHVVPYVFHEMDHDTNACNTEASHETGLISAVAKTLIYPDLITAEDTSTDSVNTIAMSGFGRRTFLSLTRALSANRQPLGVEVNYYNLPAIQPRMMSDEFRICFVADSDERESILSCRNEELTGPRMVTLLELPAAENCPKLSIPQIHTTNKVLNSTKAGVIISIKNGDIYATRYCRAGTLFSLHGRADWRKLENQIETKIFDYNDYKLCYSSPNQAPISQPFVRLSFAARDPKKAILVLTIDIWHMEALLLVRQAENSSLEPDLSLSNEFDQILTIEDMLKKPIPPTERFK
ncbi:hypothetical protein BsWGS_08034 [Bradybaena similaris]